MYVKEQLDRIHHRYISEVTEFFGADTLLWSAVYVVKENTRSTV